MTTINWQIDPNFTEDLYAFLKNTELDGQSGLTLSVVGGDLTFLVNTELGGDVTTGFKPTLASLINEAELAVREIAPDELRAIAFAKRANNDSYPYPALAIAPPPNHLRRPSMRCKVG